MTDRQTIHRLKSLVGSMFDHIYQGCGYDYDYGTCDGCRYARVGSLECARFEDFKRRMGEFGIDWHKFQ